MRLEAWQEIERAADENRMFILPEGHIAVTERPQEDTRWAASLPGITSQAYRPTWPPGAPRPERLAEPLRAKMVGFPSVDVHVSPDGGNVVQTVRLQSGYSPEIDLTRIRQLAAQWFAGLQRLSQGPLQPRDLRAMGHPYGYGQTTTISWARLRDPRRIPGYTGVYRAGARGMVTNRAVINSVSGKFQAAWRYSLTVSNDGVQLHFWNEARSDRGANYPWYLFHGTVKMQAHGPWEEVARQLMPEIHTAWRTGAAEAARKQRALVDQFGAESVAAQEAQFEEGGFR